MILGLNETNSYYSKLTAMLLATKSEPALDTL